jgi:hypothetical protein
MTPRRTLAAHRHTSRLARVVPSTLNGAAVRGTPRELSPLGDRHQGRAAGAGRDLDLPADLLHDLQAGRLSQRCPGCGTVEAAGSYCTRCYRPAGPDEWIHQERGRPASGPGKTPRNGINRGPGRPRAHPGGEPVVTDPAAGFWPA